MESFVLIVALLTVESSYRQNIERPAHGVPDTVQFWFAPDRQWRVKTFAVDHDIHRYQLTAPGDAKRLTVERARENILHAYDDVLERIVVLEFRDPRNADDVAQTLRSAGFAGSLEMSKDGTFAFYNPDGGKYRTQSEPR